MLTSRRVESAPRLVTAEQARASMFESTKSRTHPTEYEQRRWLWGAACCCALFCCVLVAVAIAYAGTAASSSTTTTNTTTTTTTGMTATVPPAPPASTETFTVTPAPTVGGASLVSDTQAAVLSLRAAVDDAAPLAIELLCNVPFAGNTTMVSYFTYTAHTDLFVAAGAANKISPRPANRGQTEYFAQGHAVGGASFAWDRARSPIVWHLRPLPNAKSIAVAVPTTAIACPSLLSLTT